MSKISASACALLGVFLFAGCDGVPSSPAPSDSSLPSSSPAPMAMVKAIGAPSPLSAQSPLGYWLWVDQTGLWHLRVTTQGGQHHFDGIIHPSAGAFIDQFDPVSPKAHGELEFVGTDLRFDFHPREAVDGIDFRLTGPGRLEFALKIDGTYDAAHVKLGATEATPEEAHFQLLPSSVGPP